MEHCLDRCTLARSPAENESAFDAANSAAALAAVASSCKCASGREGWMHLLPQKLSARLRNTEQIRAIAVEVTRESTRKAR